MQLFSTPATLGSSSMCGLEYEVDLFLLSLLRFVKSSYHSSHFHKFSSSQDNQYLDYPFSYSQENQYLDYPFSYSQENQYLDYPALVKSVNVGSDIVIADGNFLLRVSEIVDEKTIKATVLNTATIGSRKNCMPI